MTRRQSRRGGFTLVEILVVLVIIAILVAILLPVFRSAQERGYQTNCASNLNQIGIATKLYYQDEKRYPGSLAFLLTNTEILDNVNGGTGANFVNSGGGGYLRSTKSLICPDDDSVSDAPRSSYGDISTVLQTDVAPVTAKDMSRYTWNYWGYNQFGIAYPSADVVRDRFNPSPKLPVQLLVNPNPPANTTPPNPTNPYEARLNPVKKSLSNRFAPDDTIITHCIFHRGPTSGVQADALYTGTPADGAVATGGTSALDIILTLSGSAKTVNVGAWNVKTDTTTSPGNISPWQEQKF